MITAVARKLFGSANDRRVRKYQPRVDEINALEQELEKSYFLPALVRVLDITDDFGIQRWEVETDRGPRVFEVRSREDLRWLHPGHLIVRDVDGNRYEIKRFDDLDTSSRLKIESFL